MLFPLLEMLDGEVGYFRPPPAQPRRTALIA
jgi:hypothetical protein